MANHSVIKLPSYTLGYQIESVVRQVNARRFQGRLRLVNQDASARQWKARRVWAIEVPDTRPEKPSSAEPDEDLGFLFWLHENSRALEFRHAIHNRWIQWVQHVFEHELAHHFMVTEFDQGDGMRPTDIETFRLGFRDYVTRDWEKPLAFDDLEYAQNRFFVDIPKNWR